MNTYEGICKYCGSLMSVIAVSQEAANMVASKNCTCDGARMEEKRERLVANIETICEGGRGMRKMEIQEVEALKHMAMYVLQEDVDSISVSYEHSTIKVWAAGEKIKLKRTAKSEETMEA